MGLVKRLVFVAVFLFIVSFADVTILAQTCTTKAQGDADCNGEIDLVDFEIWRREFTGAATTTQADYTSNGTTRPDLVDYETWRRTYAAGTGGGATATPTSGQGVSPTPTSGSSTGYQIPKPAIYPITNANGSYFTTLGAPDSVVRWRTASHHLWNQPLPASTPKSPSSAGQVDIFNRVVRMLPLPDGSPAFGWPSAFNLEQPYVFFVDSDRENFVTVDHVCNIFEVSQTQNINGLYAGKSGIPLPAEAKMPQEDLYNDHPTVLYDYKKDIYFEFWDFLTPNIRGGGNASTCLGIGTTGFVAGNGMGHPGIMNSGIPRSGTMITLEEAYKLKINHVINVQSYQERGDQESYPATQYMGVYNCATASIYNRIGGIQNCIFDGQRMRLPANYDTSKISHPFARAVAEALKTYGLIIADYAGCNCVEIEGARTSSYIFGNPNPWDAVFAPLSNGEVYAQIPWQDLEVLPQNWGKP